MELYSENFAAKCVICTEQCPTSFELVDGSLSSRHLFVQSKQWKQQNNV